MKKKISKIGLSTFKFLLFLPILLLSYCDSSLEDPLLNSENRLSKEAEVLLLMKAAIQNGSDQNLTSNKNVLSKVLTDDDDRCTYFLYPMTFEVFSGDDPNPELVEINSDEELLSFIDAFTFEEDKSIATTPNYELYIFFPVTLLDSDGVETELKDLTELEGTLKMAVEACESFKDETSGSDGSNDGTGGGTAGDSSDGSDDETEESSDEVTDTGSDGGSDDESEESTDQDADEASNEGSDDGTEDGADDKNENESDTIDSSSDEDKNSCGKNGKKVTICHKGITICVSVNALWGHMQHHEEDYLGACDD